LGGVRYEGLVKTRPGVVEGLSELEPGALLNPTQAERGRHRLARLGIFDRVDLSYAPTTGETREVVYDLKESKTVDLSLLFGYGSYELLRGGVELEQRNLFGLAHHSRFRAVQSFKSTSGDYRYTLPEVAGSDASLFFNASGLRRKEISFVREEWGGSLGSQRFFPSIQSDLGLRYNYSLLQADDADADISDTARRAWVGSLLLDLKHDRRDNPLVPRRGYKVYSNLELASRALGGQVNFQRFELASAKHMPIGGGRYLHLGLTHGAILTLGGDHEDIPFNKRFFPGGENSVRGFQQGEAGPRDAEGHLVGAETYLQGNIEFEQVLVRSWSVVLFLDGVGYAEDVSDYPWDDRRYSAGLGIRWKTLLGPARLEYGRNLNPGRDDPEGTLHFSIGFPF
jgi:outer membrane protein assembly factor BamA